MKRTYVSHLKWPNLLLIGVLVLVSFSLRPAITQQTPSLEKTKIGFIGDSITHGPKKGKSPVDNEIANLGDTFVGINRGVNGSTTTDWQPGRLLFNDAIAVFKAQNVHTVSIMLGTNDSRSDRAISPATYRRNMEIIIENLLSSGVVTQVIVNYPPYVVPGSGPWDELSEARLKLYAVQLDAITKERGVAKGDTRAFSYFKEHIDQLIDGIHPNEAGREALGRMWADAYEKVLARQVSKRQLTSIGTVASDRL